MDPQVPPLRTPREGATSDARRCACGFKLWPAPQARRIRFHDLRHTTATLLLKAGAPLAVVQRILRHPSPTITIEIYGHLDLDDMRFIGSTSSRRRPRSLKS